MKRFILLTILVFILAIFSNIGAVCLALFAYIGMNVLITFLDNNPNHKNSHKVYQTIFISSTAYLLICYAYMNSKGYDYLLVYDTYNVFIPNVSQLLKAGSIRNIFEAIWSKYSIFDNYQCGFYSFLTFWAVIGRFLGTEIYLSVQIGLLSVCSLTPMLIYKLLRESEIDENSSVKYATIIGICSVLFYYTNLVLRDGLIALLLVYIFYTMKHPVSIGNLVRVFISLFLISTLRIETGLLSIIFVPAYFIIWTTKKSPSGKLILLGVITLSIGLYCGLYFFKDILELYEMNNEYYTQSVIEQDRVISSLQRLPPVIKDVASIIFNALLPLPCWSKMVHIGAYAARPECYNIMNFPMVIYSFFGLYIIISLCYYFFNHCFANIDSHLRFCAILLFPGALFLSLQSAVTTQRRIMGVYVLFYLLWAIIHERTSKHINDGILVVSVVIYLLIQLVVSIL